VFRRTTQYDPALLAVTALRSGTSTASGDDTSVAGLAVEQPRYLG